MSSIALGTRLEYSKVAFDRKHTVHLLVTLEGKSLDEDKRKPLSIGVAIDCSGSMGGEKIEYAKKSLLKLVEHLTSKDTLSIVGFSDAVFSILKPKRMTAEAKEEARAEIMRLRSLASTNLSGGLLEAYQNTGDTDRAKGTLVRAFLFTDGLPTAGITDKGKLVEMAGQRPEGVSLTCFGYGADHDPELMASMAKQGGGNFWFVKTPDECPAFFGRELGGLLSCVAQTVKLKLTAAPGVRIVEVLNDLDVDAKEDGSEATVSVDDVYAEEKRKVLVRLELPEKSKAVAVRPSKVCDIEASFQDLRVNEPRSESTKVTAEYVREDEADKSQDKEVLEQIEFLKAAEAQAEAEKLADRGQFAQAQQMVLQSISRLKAVGTEFADAVARDLDVNVVQCYSQSSYGNGGKLYSHSNRMGYMRGRGMTAHSSEMTSSKALNDFAHDFAQDTVPPVQPMLPPVAPQDLLPPVQPMVPPVQPMVPPVQPMVPTPPKAEGVKSLAKKRKNRR
jgi:Ca-activated chloride channel homolog